VKAQAGINLARWHIAQGDVTAAEDLLRQVEALGLPDLSAELYRTQAVVEYHRGHYDAARPLAEQSLAAAEEMRAPSEIGRTQRVLGEALSRLGLLAEAETAYAAAAELFGDNEYEQELTRTSREKHLGGAE
jgi:tetratricopeptide (TPR) repeat protein